MDYQHPAPSNVRCEWCAFPAQAGKSLCAPCEADFVASEKEGQELVAADFEAEKALGTG